MPGARLATRTTLDPTTLVGTRMAAFRQDLDEDLRHFIPEGIIPIPTTHDVPAALVELRKFIRRQRNPLLDGMEFYGRAQQSGESFDTFYTSLRELFHACNFSGLSVCGTCTRRLCRSCTLSLQALADDILRDRVVISVLADEVRHKLLAVKDLTQQACVDLCRAEEAASQTTSRIPPQVARGSAVNAVKSSYQKQKKSSGSASKSSSGASSTSKGQPGQCSQCGRTAHTKRPCPAANRKCTACQRIGHFFVKVSICFWEEDGSFEAATGCIFP